MFAPSDAVRSITLPTSSAIKCNALNLSRYWKTGLSAESQPLPQLQWDGDWIVCQLRVALPRCRDNSLSRKRRFRRNY